MAGTPRPKLHRFDNICISIIYLYRKNLALLTFMLFYLPSSKRILSILRDTSNNKYQRLFSVCVCIMQHRYLYHRRLTYHSYAMTFLTNHYIMGGLGGQNSRSLLSDYSLTHHIFPKAKVTLRKIVRNFYHPIMAEFFLLFHIV